MATERISFKGHGGDLLQGRLELPPGEPRGYVLFAHCFTCSSQSTAASRLAWALAEKGFAVLRFDFTGLGGSEGEFANTGFSSNVEDLVLAAGYLREHKRAPALLLGHSLGGTAVLRAARRIAEVKAVATIGAPFEPAHVTRLFGSELEKVERDGAATVSIGGREVSVSRALVEDIKHSRVAEDVRQLERALLVFHSPVDEVVAVENAKLLYEAARHPKSFVSVDGADHLLSRAEDAKFVASMLAAWADRYLSPEAAAPQIDEAPKVVQVEERGELKFAQQVRVGRHGLVADEPVSMGGADLGLTPYDLLTAALGVCTSMTVRMYARHKGWPLEKVALRLRHGKVHAQDCADCTSKEGKIDRIERHLFLEGPLSPEQRQRLVEIADRCPVHRTLMGEVKIETRLAEGPLRDTDV